MSAGPPLVLSVGELLALVRLLVPGAAGLVDALLTPAGQPPSPAAVATDDAVLGACLDALAARGLLVGEATVRADLTELLDPLVDAEVVLRADPAPGGGNAVLVCARAGSSVLVTAAGRRLVALQAAGRDCVAALCAALGVVDDPASGPPAAVQVLVQVAARRSGAAVVVGEQLVLEGLPAQGWRLGDPGGSGAVVNSSTVRDQLRAAIGSVLAATSDAATESVSR